MSGPSIADLIRAHRVRWVDFSTGDAVFGLISPEEVAGWFERVSAVVLGAPIQRGLFFGASAGCVAGVELADGRSLVMKAYQRRWRLDHLRAASQAAMGAALYTLAYTARCEHSLQARNPSLRLRRARDTLIADHTRFLEAIKTN